MRVVTKERIWSIRTRSVIGIKRVRWWISHLRRKVKQRQQRAIVTRLVRHVRHRRRWRKSPKTTITVEHRPSPITKGHPHEWHRKKRNTSRTPPYRISFPHQPRICSFLRRRSFPIIRCSPPSSIHRFCFNLNSPILLLVHHQWEWMPVWIYSNKHPPLPNDRNHRLHRVHHHPEHHRPCNSNNNGCRP